MGYTVHGILQARILEWVTFPFSRWSSQPRDWTQVSHIAGWFFTMQATREASISINPFLIIAEKLLIIWIYYNLFIYSPLQGHLTCFQVLASKDKSAINVCVQVCMDMLFSCSVVPDSWTPHYRTPGFPVLHHLLELAQTHIHWVNDAIQPSHSL